MVTYLLSFNNMFLIIAGHPATGKTTLSEKLKAVYPDHTLLHTDDYMEYGYKESVYKLIEDLESYEFQNIIVEGIMGARLMRKLQEVHKEATVDLYVYFSAKFDHIIDVYTRERPDKKLKDIEATIKGLDTVHNSIDLSTQAHLNINISDFAEHDKLPDILKSHL